MKCFLGLLLVLVMMAACHRHATETIYIPSQRLVAIDTLMQSRPDSALTLLMDTTEQGPYYQLLLSEALYKNDYAQANRAELLDAMAYFDSIGEPFLAARCHYMNGVGYYELDSVVPACAEYLKALEIMEEKFGEEELVGYKAKYMALAYSHLCELFTKQYLHLQAVEVAQKAYKYYQRFESLSWQSAWVLTTIGSNYHAMNQLDSANFYFQKASVFLNDTNCLLFRDISEHRALIDYEKGIKPDKQLRRLKSLLSQAKTVNEYYSRCLAIGDVLYEKTELDSAKMFLEIVYFETHNVALKKQAAELLVAIHKKKGEFVKASSYGDYLAPFANTNENQGFVKSQLVNIYQNHELIRKEDLHRQQIWKNQKRVVIILIVIAVIVALVVVLYFSRTKQLKDERHEHKMKQAALAGRLRQSNLALKKERKNNSEELTPINKSNYSDLVFEEEPICRHITSVCNDDKKPIKTNIPVSAYAEIALTCTQIAQLKEAANRHFGALFISIKTKHPELKEKDLIYCYLCLLGLDNSQIAAMTQLSYRTIWGREKRLQKIFNTQSSISVVLHDFLIDNQVVE